MTTRVVVADDHNVVRAGLVMVLGLDADIEVVAEASNGQEAIDLARELQPDVVLMDLQMPEVDGVAATKAIRAELPTTHVLILTTYDTDQSIVRAVDAGAAGYLLKDASPADILHAIKTAATGSTVLAPEIAAKLAAGRKEQPVQDLTERELDVLQLVAQGHSNPQIAKELFISLATVKTHLIHVFQKLAVDDRTAAVTKALDLGIIDL